MVSVAQTKCQSNRQPGVAKSGQADGRFYPPKKYVDITRRTSGAASVPPVASFT